MTKIIEISQLHSTPEGTYINGIVEGWLSQIRPPNGRGPSKARLEEGAGSIEVSLWGGGVSHWEGKRVRFSGKGMQMKEYKGTKSLSVGDKVLIEPAAPADHNPDLEAAKPIKQSNVHQGGGGGGAGFVPPQRIGSPTGPATDSRLAQYSAFYAHCVRGARAAINEVSMSDDPETTRQIATCFFIQGLKEGLERGKFVVVAGESANTPF